MSQTTEQEPKTNITSVSLRNLKSRLANVSLGIWGYYFIAKFALYWKELIGFHALENLAFATFILFPVKQMFWRRVKQVAVVPLAVALLYYDSWLPPIGRLISQAALLSSFSSDYQIELAGRFIRPAIVAMLVAVCAAYWLVSRRVRLDAIIIAVMAIMAIMPMKNSFAQEAARSVSFPAPKADTIPDIDNVLKNFFAQEAARSVSLSAPKVGAIPFDVIFIHVCSLSWDDVQATGLEHHPLWQRFDILLTRFNTASTYSGPAVIRMLRATCGQPSHASLYAPTSDKCYLMDSLKRSGFEPGLAMNHDGRFDQFLKTVQIQGGLNVPPSPLDGVAIHQRSFDNSPIYDDLSLLSHWLENRQKSASPRVALFYNTISLHDGNRLTGANSKLNSKENFKIRLVKLLDDLEAFLQNMEKSGRRAVVAMIPEHGAALRGDKMQISGLREIPSPSITLVPVGIKVIGANFQRVGNTLLVDKPTSYLAVAHIVSRLLEKPPRTTFKPSDYVVDLPVTPFVSQNDGAVMVGNNQRYYLRQDASGWLEYTDFLAPNSKLPF